MGLSGHFHWPTSPRSGSSGRAHPHRDSLSPQGWTSILPGLLVCLVAGVLAWFVAHELPGLSALLLAILAGALWRNLAPVPTSLNPGVHIASKQLLRLGIVLLGFQLSRGAILGLGPGVLLVTILSVAITFAATLWIGKLLGIGLAQRLLIASGFSICGAAAVAATDNAVKAKDEETATALALVVSFGTAMIPAVPFLGHLLGLPDHSLGMWIGASTHEVAQVVAAGGAVGGGALTVAVTVKLARVLMLAPIIAGVTISMNRRGDVTAGERPPVVPLFVLGFVGTMLIRSTGVLPEGVLAAAQVTQTLLLAVAMFALGLGVHVKSLLKVGGRPVLLGLLSTVVIMTVSLAGTYVFPAH